MDRVKQWWDSYHFQGSLSFVVANKLKVLKVHPRIWNEEVFSDVGKKKKILFEEVCAFDTIEEEKTLGNEKRRKEEVVSELERSTRIKEVSWRQKSRALKLREGDNANRRKNFINSFWIDGTLSTNRVEINKYIVQFYKKLYIEQFIWWPLVDDLSIDLISEAKTNYLEREFEKREVLKVVKAINGDKVLGPNSYSMALYQACWDMLKENIMKVFREFHARGKFERSLSATFIALILKISRAVDPIEFCLTSLVSRIYKIIAKILTNRHKMVLGKIVSKSQNAFV